MDEHFCDPKLSPGACSTCAGKPRPYVRVRSWAGHRDVDVEILGRTPKRVRVRFLEDTVRRKRGDVALVDASVVQRRSQNEGGR